MNRDRLLGTARGLGERSFKVGFNELGGFRKFILRGNVVDLAVGVVIGAAFSGLVQEFTKDFISPLIGGLTNLSFLAFAIPLYGDNKLQVGAFINVFISFLITAAVVYFCVVRPVAILQDRFTPHHEVAVTTRDCPFCLSAVPLKATRCAFCTSQLPPAETPSMGHRS
ncbi:MAG TPA: large-conductance mechanosensitive channel protein MscL [Ktedonobacteraceae bacterium]|jgi:large conductance mechanosensitive channel